MDKALITISGPYKKLGASKLGYPAYMWEVTDGDICDILEYDINKDVYLLRHPAHPNEPFDCMGQFVTHIGIDTPFDIPPVVPERPKVCACSMQQLWKTGCICGHITKFVSKRI